MTTNTNFAMDSVHLEEMVANNTELMNDLKVIDEEISEIKEKNKKLLLD